MKKNILVILGVLAVSLLMVSCAPAQTGKAVEAELEQLSDAELEQVIAEGEAAQSAAVAGQATASSKVAAAKLPYAYKVAYARLKSTCESDSQCSSGKYCSLISPRKCVEPCEEAGCPAGSGTTCSTTSHKCEYPK